MKDELNELKKEEQVKVEERSRIFLYPSLQTTIQLIREGRKPDFDKKNYIVETIYNEIFIAMESIGGVKFFYDNNSEYIFHKANKLIIRVDREERDFRAFIFAMGINPADTLFDYILSGLKIHVRNMGVKIELKRLIHYDIKRNTLYIKNGNGIVKITKDKVETVDNGEDNVFFIDEAEHEAFKIEETKENYVQKHLIGNLNFEIDNLTAEETRFVLEAWIYSLFFEEIQPTKPILTFWGEKGSGKTVTLQKIGSFLTGRDYDVSPLTADEKDLKTSLINSRFFFIDNADKHYSWFANLLALTATGQKIKLRKLYTDSVELSYPIKCFIGITTRTPTFNRDDVCDRTILVRVKRFEDFIPEKSILNGLYKNRDKIWGFVIKRLQMILADLEAPAVENCTFRMADFYNFIHLTHKTINPKVNVKDLFKKLEEEQNALFRDGDILAELLEEWLDREANLGRSMTTSELYLEIKGLWEQKGNKDFIYKSAIGFGKALPNTIQLFRGKYRVLCQKGAGRKKEYQFNRIDAVSRACELFNGKVQGEK